MRRSWRRFGIVLAGVIVSVGALGLLIRVLPGRAVEVRSVPTSEGSAVLPQDHSRVSNAHASELRRRFDEAVVMLHARRHEYALIALDQVLALDPLLPEAHVNRGFAWIGLGRPEEALTAFERALDLRPDQANAYYGLALALEQMGDRARALGAMRTFVHLTPASDPFVPKARAALWEWQAAAEGRPGGESGS